MRHRPRVALIIETSNDYARGLLHGVRAWIREHEPWSIFLAEHGRGDEPPAWLSDWQGDGIIARIESRKIARAVKKSGRPAVDVSAGRHLPELPWVETDDEAIARLAADHLMERGFRHFAYCGDDRFNWSTWRREAFEKMVTRAGHSCDTWTPRPGEDDTWERHEEALVQWIDKLPRPVGIFACYDIRGQQILEACRRLGLAVPDEVAVIGVDNDELLCDLYTPPLSSVVPDTHRTGYEAARLLDRIMRGENVGADAHPIRPVGVVTRESTDVTAIDDRDVSTAVRFIRDHACEGINVEDVLEQIPLSRRVLESRFKTLIGRSPHEQILKTRLDRVCLLLTETDLPLTRVAERCGFKHVEYLSAVFKKKIGTPPSTYRQNRRG